MEPELSYKNADDVLNYKNTDATSSITLLKNRYEFYYILILALSSFTFFRPAFLEPIYLRISNLNNYLFLVLFLPAIPFIFKNIFKKNKYLFTLPLRLITIAIIISIIMANVFWGQKIMDSVYGALLPVFGYTFYFYLMEKSISIKIIERVIIIIGLAFIVFFLFSFSVYPIRIFDYKETNDREFLRLFLYGDGFLFLFYFFALNKLLNGKAKIWLVLVLAAFLCMILNQTRVYLISTAAITIFYLVRSKSVLVKIISIAMVISAFLILPQIDFVQGLQTKTQNDLGNSDDYIRVKAGKYFLNKFQQSPFTRVFGNGFYAGKDSYYSKEIKKLQTERGFYVQDVGMIGLYAFMGILPLIAYLLIFLRGLRTKLVAEYDYLKMFIIFIICSCLTTDSTFSGSYVFPIVFTLYLYEHCRTEAQKSLIYTPLNK